MTVIAMNREIGSNSKAIATALAVRLGLTVLQHEPIERKLAARLGIACAPLHRYLAGQATVIERWRIDEKCLGRFAVQELVELAQLGNVLIRGWAAAALLKTGSHVLRVRVCAPMHARVRLLRERIPQLIEQEAVREIVSCDKDQAAMMRRLFAADREDPTLYDLVLNTEQVNVSTCVDQIAALARSPRFQQTAVSQAALADMLAEARVHSTRYHDFAGAIGEPFIEAASFGEATLTEAASHERAIAKMEQLVRGGSRPAHGAHEFRFLPPTGSLI